VIGTFLLSLSTTYLQIFLSQSICLGLALGLMFSPCLSCVGTYYKKRRSTAIGIVASGAAIGAIMFPILLNSLFASHGFAFAVRAGQFHSLILSNAC
jgi:MFS family permease